MRFLLITFLVAATLPAVNPTDAAAPKDTLKYWVFFADKAIEGDAFHPAPARLSERTRDRRTLRGWHEANATDLDIPVSPEYVEAVREVGARIVIKSRWLNAVSAVMTEDEEASVREFSFVRDVRPVGIAIRSETRLVQASVLLASITDETASPVVRTTDAAQLEYGSSFEQLNLVNAIDPLEAGINGAGVRVGILDTEYGGFQHPVFDSMVSEGRLIEYRNFTGGSQLNRHGRNVLSIMAGFSEGNLIGPAHKAEILAASTEWTPSETNQEEDFFVAALEWMESMGVDVVNVSLGYSTFDAGQNSYTTADLDGDTGVTTRAADAAASLGVLVVAAAGNSGCSSPTSCWYFVTTPADGDSVLAVGGTFSSGSRVSFSGRGPTADGRVKPDVAALGVGVVLTDGGGQFTTGSGTSYATPIVAGVAAQVLQVNPFLSPIEVRDILRMTASQATNPDNDLGWGIVDAAAAVAMAQGPLGNENEVPLTLTVGSVVAYPNPFTSSVNFQLSSSGPVPHAELR
ncbi:MAG: S8 family serine peptidase, partial [Rhodothermia bacterium]|nr:S8 family serine peptidase [Rhodothermia bacterium]